MERKFSREPGLKGDGLRDETADRSAINGTNIEVEGSEPSNAFEMQTKANPGESNEAPVKQKPAPVEAFTLNEELTSIRWWRMEAARNPFDPESELTRLKGKRPTDRTASEYELSRRVYGLQVQEYKHALLLQKTEIAESVADLKFRLQSGRFLSAEDLKSHCQVMIDRARIGQLHKIQIEYAAKALWQRQEAIQKALEQYPDPKELFKACFGFESTGEIDLRSTALSIGFVLDEEDFGRVYGFQKDSQTGEISFDEELTKRAQKTHGAALTMPGLGIPGLENAITIVSRDRPHFEEQYVENDYLDDLTDPIEMRGQQALLSGSYAQEDGYQLLVYTKDRDPNGGNAIDVYRRTPHPSDQPKRQSYQRIDREGGVRWQEVFYDEEGNRTIGDPLDEIRIMVNEADQESSFIHIQGDRLTATATTNHPMHRTVRFGSPEYKSTQTHEEQHQIERLFHPDERPLTEAIESEDRKNRIVEQTSEPYAQIKVYTKEIAQSFRRMPGGVNTKGRDEFLASYAGGQKAENITFILTQPYGGYDYARNDVATQSLRSYLTEQASDFYSTLNQTRQEHGQPSLTEVGIDKQVFQIMLEEVVDEDWTTGYYSDVETWGDAVMRLEQKGYTRDEILNLLYVEPTHGWNALSRRLPDR